MWDAKEEDVDTNKRDLDPDGGQVACITDSCSDYCNKKLAYKHTQGAPDQKWTTSDFLHRPEGDRRGTHIHERCN